MIRLFVKSNQGRNYRRKLHSPQDLQRRNPPNYEQHRASRLNLRTGFQPVKYPGTNLEPQT